jgi:hypothetical protein
VNHLPPVTLILTRARVGRRKNTVDRHAWQFVMPDEAKKNTPQKRGDAESAATDLTTAGRDVICQSIFP